MRKYLLTLVMLLVGTAGPALAQGAADRVLGKTDAPITIIEYASLTCPHCAEFHNTVLPELKKQYVDTGKVKFIYRDFPLDQLALRAAMLARCAPEERYFAFVEVLFKNQQSWAAASDPMAALSRIGRLGGVPAEKIESCLNDKALADAVLESRMTGAKDFDVKSTPTILVNGKKVDALTFPELDRLLKPLAS